MKRTTLFNFKAQLDMNFLINCQNVVFPKFINVYLPNLFKKDVHGIQKKL